MGEGGGFSPVVFLVVGVVAAYGEVVVMGIRPP